MTGFELADLVVGNGSPSALQGNSSSFSATIHACGLGGRDCRHRGRSRRGQRREPRRRGRPALDRRGPSRRLVLVPAAAVSLRLAGGVVPSAFRLQPALAWVFGDASCGRQLEGHQLLLRRGPSPGSRRRSAGSGSAEVGVVRSAGLSFAHPFQHFVEPDRLVAGAFDGHVCVSPGGVVFAVEVSVDVDGRHGPPTERKVCDGRRGIGVEGSPPSTGR